MKNKYELNEQLKGYATPVNKDGEAFDEKGKEHYLRIATTADIFDFADFMREACFTINSLNEFISPEGVIYPAFITTFCSQTFQVESAEEASLNVITTIAGSIATVSLPKAMFTSVRELTAFIPNVE